MLGATNSYRSSVFRGYTLGNSQTEDAAMNRSVRCTARFALVPNPNASEDVSRDAVEEAQPGTARNVGLLKNVAALPTEK